MRLAARAGRAGRVARVARHRPGALGAVAVSAALLAGLPGQAGATGAVAARSAGAVVARPARLPGLPGLAGRAARAGLATPAAPAYTPYQGTLRPGMTGPAVLALQQRLAQLHYYPGPANGRFGTDTLEAVWAFKEVQGLHTRWHADDVGHAMQLALVSPRPPRVLVRHGGHWRIEVNLTAEVLVLYHHNKVKLISHISAGGGYYYPCVGGGTCGPAITLDGDYRANWFAHGWLTVPLGTMYNPVFFIGGLYAIHGDIPVPLQPASHGCVRVPMDIAGFFHKLIRISPSGGTPIYIRGLAPGT